MLGLVLVTACRFQPLAARGDATPNPHRDAPSAGSDAAVHDAPLLDAAGSDAPGDMDSDGDGVPDSSDDCPTVYDPMQHDEDGDLVGDLCDPCPQVANAPTTDSDADGIPDACDPHPDTPGDKLVDFEPFTGTGNIPMGWTLRGAGSAADWVLGNDALTVTAGNTHILIYNAQSDHHAIDIGLDIVSTETGGGNDQFVTALTDTSADIQQFFGCGLRVDNHSPAPDREMFAYDNGSNPQFNALDTDLTEPPTASGSYRMVFVMDGSAETCTIPSSSAQHAQSNTFDSQGNTYVGLRANNLKIRFRYAAIYTF